MGNLNKFSLRELLQIVIPGVYFISLIKPIVSKIGMPIQNYSENVNLVLSFLLSLIVGMIIYAIDIPKKIWFFNNNLPTKLIERNKDLGKNIHNKYFDFYDNNISDKQKGITEKYTSIFHFSVNISVVSFVLSIIYVFAYCGDFSHSYGVITLIILILSIVLSQRIFFGKRKIKYMFTRQYEKFINSLNK